MKSCYYCGTTKEEMRPYGPNCSYVCFGCAMQTPERKSEAERNFISQLEAAGPVVILGGEDGPVPAIKTNLQ